MRPRIAALQALAFLVTGGPAAAQAPQPSAARPGAGAGWFGASHGAPARQVPADSASLVRYVQRYQTTWNTRDAAAVAAYFAEDADLVMGNEPSVRGRAAIEASWQAYFDVQEEERRGRFDVTFVRLLAPEVAVIDLTSTTGAPGNDTLVTRRARGTWLVRKEGGDWTIAAMRGMPTAEDEVELIPWLGDAADLRPDIRAFVRAYEDAFNRHDPDALTALFTSDADYIVRTSPVVRGARAIRDWWTAYFGQSRPYRALMLIDEIRMMSDDVALVNITATGATPGPSERLGPVRTARGTWILVREDGEWRISALRVLPSEGDRLIRTPHRRCP